MFLLIMIIPGIIIISVGEELSEHLLNVVQDFLLGLEGLLLSFNCRRRSSLSLSTICTDTLSVCIELTVAEKACPLSSPSSSNHCNNLFVSYGDVIPVEEDGCS